LAVGGWRLAVGGWRLAGIPSAPTLLNRSPVCGVISSRAKHRMSSYRDLEVWQKARKLATHIYRRTSKFPRREWDGLVQQMRRAAVSVPCNIAEAHGRQTSRDRGRFLGIARGSLLELETQAFIAGDLAFLTERQAEIVVDAANELARQLNGLIRHYRTRG
ncbi:MAG: four helix bundle protein, partial [Acidobacteriota bacterium]